MRVNLNPVLSMAKESKNLQTGTFMLGSTWTESRKDTASTTGKWGPFTRGSFKTDWGTGLEFGKKILCLIVINTRESIKTIKNQGRGYLFDKMEIVIKEIILMIWDMGMEKCFGRTGLIIRGYGRKVSFFWVIIGI